MSTVKLPYMTIPKRVNRLGNWLRHFTPVLRTSYERIRGKKIQAANLPELLATKDSALTSNTIFFDGARFPFEYRASSGFTFPELIMVIAILGAFAVIAIPNVLAVNGASKEVECIYRLRTVESAKASYVMDRGGDPVTVTNQPAFYGYLPGEKDNYIYCPLSTPETREQHSFNNVYDLYKKTICPNHPHTSSGW